MKLRIFDACICAKLRYGLFTATMTAKERKRIDGFQARCLRRILRIAPSFYSRVSNDTVLKRAGETSLSRKIACEQIKYKSKFQTRDQDDPTRVSLMMRPAERKQGRPRASWVSELEKSRSEVAAA